MEDDVVAVLTIVGETRSIVAIQVAAQGGEVVHPVAVLPADIAHGWVKPTVEGHPVLQLEGRRARIAW